MTRRMVQRLGALERTLYKIVEQHLQEKLPDVLYHYTTWDGFRGIVQSQQFWATDHRDTNDEGELQSADGIIVSTAKELRSSTPPYARPALDQFLRAYQGTIRYLSLPVRAAGLIDLSEVMLGPKCPHTDEMARAELAAAGYRDNMPPVIRSSVVLE